MISNTKDSKNFMNNIRIYNNLFAFASFGVKFVTFQRGRPTGPQVYVIDNELVNNIRLQNQNSKNFSLSLLAELHNFIRTINPYPMAFKK